MNNKLENKLQELVKDFSIEPNDNIWNDIEKELHPKRKRRFAFLWLFPVITLIAGFGVWKILSSPTQKDFSEVNNLTNSKTNNKVISQSKNLIEEKQTIVINSNEIKEAKRKHIENKIEQRVAEKTRNKLTHNKQEEVEIKSVVTKIEKENYANNAVDKNTNLVTDEKSKLVTEQSKKNAVDIAVKSDTVKKKDNKNSTTKKPKQNSWKHYATLSTGYFNEIVENNSKAQSYANALSTIINNPVTQKTNSPEAGINIKIGYEAEKSLTNKFSISLGFLYHFIQTKQLVGNKQDSAFLQKGFYYTMGNSNKVSNQIHALQIPFLINYSFNPKSKTIIQLQTGLLANVLLLKKWVVNKNGWLYQYDNQSIKTLQTSASIGLNIVTKNKIKFSANYSTLLSKFYTYSSNKNHQINFQVAVPLTSKK